MIAFHSTPAPKLANMIRERDAAVARAENFRIEADKAMQDYDALDLVAREALEKITQTVGIVTRVSDGVALRTAPHYTGEGALRIAREAMEAIDALEPTQHSGRLAEAVARAADLEKQLLGGDRSAVARSQGNDAPPTDDPWKKLCEWKSETDCGRDDCPWPWLCKAADEKQDAMLGLTTGHRDSGGLPDPDPGLADRLARAEARVAELEARIAELEAGDDCSAVARGENTEDAPILREHAIKAAQNALRNQGYAVAVHGSLVKDVDMIAVPWRDTAVDAQAVAEIVAAAIPGFIEKGSPEAMPHGRLSFTIRPNWHYGFDSWYIDLAVMPRTTDDCPERSSPEVASLRARVEQLTEALRLIRDGQHSTRAQNIARAVLVGDTE